ncbi:MAG: hypothetical protein KYX66_13980 [Blastomonas fulva]|uniref:hypothetical protein n=1 Tax=Blastomonas fulva TaxID=1550728 RepID=UPI0024E1A6A7|nr:hypothetical protein [Blastomonas fulva]MDK2757829.1 hypothetical protein [Blastomonas fulva]
MKLLMGLSRAMVLAGVAVVAAPTAFAASPAELGAARRYVESIYQRLPGDFDYRSVRYTPALKALIARDDACAAAGGGYCVIDAVPFCDCQDTGTDYRIVGSTVTAIGRSGARVTVNMRNGGKVRYSVDLTLAKGVWYVADIATPAIPSFAAKLKQGLR